MIYALSDIHGCLKPLRRVIRGTLSEAGAGDTVVFLGDLMDGGTKSGQVLAEVKRFSEESGAKVVLLLGNHEDLFLQWVFGESGIRWSEFDADKRVLKTLLSRRTMARLHRLSAAWNERQLDEGYREALLAEQGDLLEWMRGMELYYETPQYIFVHAGVDESLGADWKKTKREYMLWSSDVPRGRFVKTIVAGHNRTSEITGDPAYHDIFYDGFSHYYIDGDTVNSGKLPVLVLAEEGRYEA